MWYSVVDPCENHEVQASCPTYREAYWHLNIIEKSVLSSRYIVATDTELKVGQRVDPDRFADNYDGTRR